MAVIPICQTIQYYKQKFSAYYLAIRTPSSTNPNNWKATTRNQPKFETSRRSILGFEDQLLGTQKDKRNNRIGETSATKQPDGTQIQMAQAQHYTESAPQASQLRFAQALWQSLGTPPQRFTSYQVSLSSPSGTVSGAYSISTASNIVMMDHLSSSRGSNIHQSDLFAAFCNARQVLPQNIDWLIIPNIKNDDTAAVYDQIYGASDMQTPMEIPSSASAFGHLLATPLGRIAQYSFPRPPNAITLMTLSDGSKTMAFWEATAPAPPATFPPPTPVGPTPTGPATTRRKRGCCIIM
ncbi:hypothetical protein PV04_10313 [Phialophora macrospora]|uniref:Uncharacterized protein n=1 Tax=Phialophora macrospora TaxID=1851006 RepID=A0A0D2CEH2_9EURO|nr:hypothetical protein PV04_10313 [Phialophora macrospora]